MIFLYFSAVSMWVIIGFILLKPIFFRLSFHLERTTWEKKIYGLTCMWWNKPKYFDGCRCGKSLFVLIFRNPEKMSDDIKKSK